MSKERFSLPVAVQLLLIQDGQVLLLRRFKTGWMDGMYGLVAGHLDGNESITEAMAREAAEEAGISIDTNDLEVVHIMHTRSNREYIYFFLTAKRWKGTPTLKEKDKADDLCFFPLNNLPDTIIPNVKDAILYYQKGTTFSERVDKND